MALPSNSTDFTLAEARDAVAAKKISSRELTSAFVKAVEAARPLNAFVSETPQRALEMAAASDARIAKGQNGPLEGLPLAIKDLFCTKGVRTTAGSKILGNFVPPYESTVTQNLWNAGAVLLGKTNMDEFAMGSSNEIQPFRACDQPLARAEIQRAACAGRFVGRFGGCGGRESLSCRHGHRHRRLDPPAGRASPAPSASSRLTGVARAGASSRSHLRWIRRVR